MLAFVYTCGEDFGIWVKDGFKWDDCCFIMPVIVQVMKPFLTRDQ